MSPLSAGPKVPDEVHAIIEIPAFSEPVKYEMNKEAHLLMVDRFLSTAMQYPANYGFIPNTLSEDGDPIDILVVTPTPLRHGCALRVRPIGLLKMTDEAGIDTKILSVPVNKLTPLYQNVQEPKDLPAPLLKQIEHFFVHYKDLEQGKWVKVDGWLDAAAAKQAILDSVKRAG